MNGTLEYVELQEVLERTSKTIGKPMSDAERRPSDSGGNGPEPFGLGWSTSLPLSGVARARGEVGISTGQHFIAPLGRARLKKKRKKQRA